MGLCYRTSTWLDRLWSEHLEVSKTARELVQRGVEKQGEAFAGFPADLHTRLYLPKDPHPVKSPPEWAAKLHGLASELGEWQRLRLMCQRNGFAAGIAAEAMLEELLPHVPERPPAPPPSSPEANPPGEHHDGEQPGQPDHPDQKQEHKETSKPHHHQRPGTNQLPTNSQPPPPTDTDLRAALRKASRSARQKVEEAESQIEGLGTPLGLSLPGTSALRSPQPSDLKAIREAHKKVKGSYRLRRIAELAGRLERIAANKARSRVKPGVGEVHGIGLGNDLSRLLPSELIQLRRPALRLSLLARLLQNKALVYAMAGREPLAKGPIIVLLDESSSMKEFEKEIWSKAVALALLAQATKKRRSWHLVAFNADIIREVAIPAGKAAPGDIERALDHGCYGGTDFDKPIMKAISIIENEKKMKQADVIIITDGEDTLTPATIEAANLSTRRIGVSWYVVAVGIDAGLSIQSLSPIATSTVWVKDTSDPEPIVPVINLEIGS